LKGYKHLSIKVEEKQAPTAHRSHKSISSFTLSFQPRDFSSLYWKEKISGRKIYNSLVLTSHQPAFSLSSFILKHFAVSNEM
jgi:hypothetical protein